MYTKIKYFSGLNALRFFAAVLVVIHHAEQIRLKNGLYNLKQYPIFNNGSIAVKFFFVLSGFLITYLLLKERSETNTVLVKKFYLRRILRIWPLYFLLVLIGTVIIPIALNYLNHPYEMPYSFKDVFVYYVFFSPFMVNLLFGHHFLEPLWSIGVEEIFYIIWAPLFKFFKKNILFIAIATIALKSGLLFAFLHIDIKVNSTAMVLVKMLEFESLAIGGLTAMILFSRKKKIEGSLLFSRLAQVVILIFIIGRLFLTFSLADHEWLYLLYNTPILSHLLLSVSFAWLIVNVSVNRTSLIKLSNKVFNLLGEISYGIYMYHMLVIFSIVLLLKNQLHALSNISATLFFYSLLLFLIIAIPYASKRFFEDYFIHLKNRFRNK